MERLRRRITLVGSCVLALLLGGCQAAAPIHVWTPPAIQSAVGKRIAIPPLAGEQAIASALHAAMFRQRPRGPGREVHAIDAINLEHGQPIRMASATEGETSDIALLTLARRSGIDFILQGEVIPPHRASRRRRSARADPMLPSASHEPDWNALALQEGVEHEDDVQVDEDAESLLRVSWNLIDVAGGMPLSGQPVVTHRGLGQSTEAMVTAAADAAWQLVIPHVIQDQAQLIAPRLALGASAVRRGNEAAAAGDWQQAQRIWEAVLHQRPRQHAAMHNLSIAAVARQDYVQARLLIAQALRTGSSPLYQRTAVWIEQRQRDYHVAFGLPDPPEGWAATSR